MHGSHQSAPPQQSSEPSCKACKELSSNLGWTAIPGSFRVTKV